MPTTVLVVDDEEILRLLVVEALTLLDLEAVECANADEALRVLETTSDIRLVITDICMPGSMDGAELGRVIWERWPELPVILSSGNRVVLNHRLPSNSSFIRKPWSLDDFHQMVNRHLGK